MIFTAIPPTFCAGNQRLSGTEEAAEACPGVREVVRLGSVAAVIRSAKSPADRAGIEKHQPNAFFILDSMNIHSITIEVADADAIPAAEAFYGTALALDSRVGVRVSTQLSSGFRGFAPSLILMQPADVDAAFVRALDDGAQVLKPVTKSLWGYGGSLLAPDGTAWQIASANKTATGPATGQIERLVLLLGVNDVKASKSFYQERGLALAKSFGSKYVEFDSGAVKLALYKRAALAKQVGIEPAGTGSHRLTVTTAGAFTDPDGYSWVADDTALTARSPKTTQ